MSTQSQESSLQTTTSSEYTEFVSLIEDPDLDNAVRDLYGKVDDNDLTEIDLEEFAPWPDIHKNLAAIIQSLSWTDPQTQKVMLRDENDKNDETRDKNIEKLKTRLFAWLKTGKLNPEPIGSGYALTIRGTNRDTSQIETTTPIVLTPAPVIFRNTTQKPLELKQSSQERSQIVATDIYDLARLGQVDKLKEIFKNNKYTIIDLENDCSLTAAAIRLLNSKKDSRQEADAFAVIQLLLAHGANPNYVGIINKGPHLLEKEDGEIVDILPNPLAKKSDPVALLINNELDSSCKLNALEKLKEAMKTSAGTRKKLEQERDSLALLKKENTEEKAKGSPKRKTLSDITNHSHADNRHNVFNGQKSQKLADENRRSTRADENQPPQQRAFTLHRI